MAGSHRQVTGTHLCSERIRLPFGGNGEGLSRRGRPILHGPSSPERAVCQPQASGQGLQDPYFAESIAAVPPTVPHNTIDGSPSTFPSCHEKFVAGTATAESLPARQDLDGSSLDKFIDEFTTSNGFQQSASSIGSSEELMSASSGAVSHNTGLSSFSIFSCEKFVAGAAESASVKELQDPHFASKELPDTTSLEESITAVPETVPHETIDGSPSTLQSSYEKFVSGAAETIPRLQDRDVSEIRAKTRSRKKKDRDVSYLEKILDEIFYSLSETSTAVPKTVSHNTIDGSPSTLQSSCGKLVSSSAETIPALVGKPVDSSSEESTTASPRTLPHNATNGCQQPASSVGSKIWIRSLMDCYQAFYIRMDRMGSFWTYPDVGAPFPSIYKADVAIINFIDELRHGARCKGQYVSRGDSNYSYFLKGPPKRDPNSQSSKTTYDKNQYLVQALLDQYNGDNNLFGDLAHELKDLMKMHWIEKDPWWYYHFNFTTKQKADESTDNKLFFAEVSHFLGERTFEINCCCIIETEVDGDHCYGCRNNRDPMQHPKNTNAYTGGHFVDGPGVILSDYDDDDDFDKYDDDDDDDDFDFDVDDDDGDDDNGEDGDDDEVDDVVEDCNVGHIVLDVCV